MTGILFLCLLRIFEGYFNPPRPSSLLGAYTSLAKGVDAIHYNPAGLFIGGDFEMLLYYQSIYSGLDKGLHDFGFALAKKRSSFSIGFGIHERGATFDDGRYSEGIFISSLSFPIGERVIWGVNFDLYYLQIPGEGNTAKAGVDFGILAILHERWRAGIFLRNFTRSSIETIEGENQIPNWISIGFCFNPFKNINTLLDIRKEPNYPARIAIAQEVNIGKNLALRGGALEEGELIKFGGGIELEVGRYRIDYAIIFHPVLPLTHSIDIRFVR